ncbi:flavin reductase family protein [Ancylobacter dichloromethanicus]|uniref:Flavin reductase n=1 Tax=Ancylobacter dichloromethanicus TaxID=518825 RepID=A0A9W6MZT1_9HYPH|nr:flavin reductase family protein [Ancylobacter dichloromethanicus]MBS7554778.1 flavin reductase family protein [Ancylobacter dichloromethanicus]GLK72463.1 flavin reductase [Ancylobacter dichloromethanicus]
MFYEPARKNHGLPHNPLKAIVAPRPIGWISTLTEDGVANLAPYSFFNLVSESPDIVMFSSAGLKDTVRNLMASGEFVCNLATLELIEAVNLTSKPIAPGESEFDLADLEQAPSRLVKPPRVAASPCALECVWIDTVDLSDRHGKVTGRHVTFGEIVGVHIDERYIEDGVLRTDRLHSLARDGYFDYSWVDALRSLPRPR